MRPHIRRHALPPRLHRGDILTLLANVRAATPEQLASLISHQRPSETSLKDAARLHNLCWRLARDGVVTTRLLRVESKALRPGERPAFRVTSAGMRIADSEASRTQRMLREVAGLGEDRGAWVEEDAIWQASFAGFANMQSVRKKLRALVRAGYLDEFQLLPKGYVKVVQITVAGDDEVERLCVARGSQPPVRTGGPNRRQVLHHLMTLQAAIATIARRSSLQFVAYETEEALRARIRAGARTTAGQTWDTLPDARVLVLDTDTASPTTAQFHVEVITRNYSDDDIRTKYENLPTKTTLFVASTPKVAELIERLGFKRPVTLAEYA